MSESLNTTNTIATYLSLITAEHADKSNFVSFVNTLVSPLVDSQTFFTTLLTAFDLDTAVGVQLDAVGQWIGRSRHVITPLSGIYFSWDTQGLGWDQGSWQGKFDPNSGLTALDDEVYRLLLKAKVIMNSWDGSIPVAAKALTTLFGETPGTTISIVDNQDMTMTVAISGVVPSAVILSLLQGGYVPIVPEGVGVNYITTSVNTTAIFGFDVENNVVAGWDVGAWDGNPGVTPLAVTGLSLVSSTATSATFSWLAPAGGTGPYSYQMQYQLGASTSGVWVLVGPPTTLTQETVTILLSSTTYTFEVYAISSSGPGPASTPLTITTPAGIPSVVTGLQNGAVTETSVALSWNPVNGTGVTYQVQVQAPGGQFVNFGAPVFTTSEVVTGLSVGTNYTFHVIAVNTFGSSLPSNPISVGTVGAIPGAVPNLAVVSVNQTNVALSWGIPLTNNGPFTYTVQFAQNVNPIVYQTFLGSTNTTAAGGSAVISGLISNQSYLFTVFASNSGGNGPVSAPVTATTNSLLPVAPTNLVASNITGTSCTLNWSTAFNATTYQLQMALTSAPTIFTNSGVPTASTTANITGLTAGVSYLFQVFGINSNSQSGPPSATVTVLTSGVGPGQVTNLVASNQTNSSVDLVWSAPTTGTGTPVYQVQYKLASAGSFTNFGSPVATTGLTVTGLQAGQTYNFDVFATNNFGNGIASSVVTTSTTGSASLVTWSPTDHSTNITLSNNNLEVLSVPPPVTGVSAVASGTTGFTLTWTPANPAGFFGARGTAPAVSSGLVYVEFTIVGSTTDFSVGIANANWNFGTTALGADANGLGIYPNAN